MLRYRAACDNCRSDIIPAMVINVVVYPLMGLRAMEREMSGTINPNPSPLVHQPGSVKILSVPHIKFVDTLFCFLQEHDFFFFRAHSIVEVDILLYSTKCSITSEYSLFSK